MFSIIMEIKFLHLSTLNAFVKEHLEDWHHVFCFKIKNEIISF